jgi:hypothetical protein
MYVNKYKKSEKYEYMYLQQQQQRQQMTSNPNLMLKNLPASRVYCQHIIHESFKQSNNYPILFDINLVNFIDQYFDDVENKRIEKFKEHHRCFFKYANVSSVSKMPNIRRRFRQLGLSTDQYTMFDYKLWLDRNHSIE